MKVIIAGPRHLTDHSIYGPIVQKAIVDSGFNLTELNHGGAKGIDSIAHNIGLTSGMMIRPFDAYWFKHGKAAGPIRNREMADYSDALIAIWDGESQGTRDMVDCMLAKKKPVFIQLV